MAGQQRVYRARIRSTASLEKIFRAMELIASSRISKARQAVASSTPYARAISRAVSAVATYSDVDTSSPRRRKTSAGPRFWSSRPTAVWRGPTPRTRSRRASSCGSGWRARARRSSPTSPDVRASLPALPQARDRRGVDRFLGRPALRDAEEIGDTLVEAFLKDENDGGVDEIHIVYTRFVSMVSQEPEIIRLLPLEVVEAPSRRPRTRSCRSTPSSRTRRTCSTRCFRST